MIAIIENLCYATIKADREISPTKKPIQLFSAFFSTDLIRGLIMKLALIFLILLSGCASTPIEIINSDVNNSYDYWDNPQDWVFPHPKGIDCTGYAIAKQIEFLKLGINSNLATCIINGQGHAVLLVGDLVLDSRYNKIIKMNQTDYYWLRIKRGTKWEMIK